MRPARMSASAGGSPAASKARLTKPASAAASMRGTSAIPAALDSVATSADISALSAPLFPYVISIARQLQPHSPPSLVGHEIGADIGELRRPAQRHGAGKLGVEVIEHRPHALGTVEREPPDDRPSDENRAGAERERFDDVGAAADAAIDVELGLAGDGVRDLQQRIG